MAYQKGLALLRPLCFSTETLVHHLKSLAVSSTSLLATVQVEVLIYAKWLHCSDVKTEFMFTILLQTPTLSFCKINLITALNHPFFFV